MSFNFVSNDSFEAVFSKYCSFAQKYCSVMANGNIIDPIRYSFYAPVI